MLSTHTHNVRVFLAAFLAAFFIISLTSVAYAATLHGPAAAIVDSSTDYTSGTIDAWAQTNLVLSFDYNAEALDSGDSFTYGWRTGSGDTDLATFNAVNEGGPVGDETGSVSVPLPSGAEVSDLEIYVRVSANSGGASDYVEITNLVVTGDADACELASETPTTIQNTDTGEYFDSVQNAIDDCDTLAGHTILMSDDVSTSAQVTISKAITLDGGGNTLSPLFAKTANNNNAAIGVIDTDNVMIQNLTIDGSGGTQLHGINLYVSDGIVINNVTSNHNRSGLVVNGSSADVTDFSTTGNSWHGINVAPGSGVTVQSALTIHNTSSHGETAPTPHIFIDDIAQDVVVDDVDGQYSFIEFGNGGVTARAYYLDTDSDDDGVDNAVDLCPGTVADTFSDFGRAKGQWQYNGTLWESSGKGDPNYQVDMVYTHGCSGSQILEQLMATTGEDYGGSFKHGLSKGLIEEWLASLL